jgi:hypothetical protein
MSLLNGNDRCKKCKRARKNHNDGFCPLFTKGRVGFYWRFSKTDKFEE